LQQGCSCVCAVLSFTRAFARAYLPHGAARGFAPLPPAWSLRTPVVVGARPQRFGGRRFRRRRCVAVTTASPPCWLTGPHLPPLVCEARLHFVGERPRGSEGFVGRSAGHNRCAVPKNNLSPRGSNTFPGIAQTPQAVVSRDEVAAVLCGAHQRVFVSHAGRAQKN